MPSPVPLYKAERTVCCVYGCKSRIRFRVFDGIKYHNLPFNSTKEKLHEWINAIKLPRRICSHMIVCSNHFQPEDYCLVDGVKELKEEAVPSRNLPKIWRNKFLPRNYGRLIKVIEVRGIGRLRLCFEAKLSRNIRRAENKRKDKRLRKKINQAKQRTLDQPPKHTEIAKESQKPLEEEVTDLTKESPERKKSTEEVGETVKTFSSNGSFSNLQNEEHSLTSEIEIKEEPLSEPEEQEETVEEMLAKMNEESQDDQHVTHIENVDQTTIDFEEEYLDWIPVPCKICGEVECIGHDEGLKFECFPCGKQFKTSRQLNAHNLSHFEYRRRSNFHEKEAICKVCNKVLSIKASLNEHMLTHANDFKQHVCMLCDKTFRHKANLVMHINSHTIHPNHRCKMCGECFEDSDELDEHVRKHRVLTREYTCRECGQRFKSKQACWAHFNSHMRAKSKTGLACQVCGRVLSTKATLKEHMFIHSGEKPFECQLCGKKIRHRANFIIHVQGHSLGQPHLCNLCGMGFAKKSELCSHTAAEHPEDRPFLCTICGMRFRTESRFLRHAVSHDAYLEDEI